MLVDKSHFGQRPEKVMLMLHVTEEERQDLQKMSANELAEAIPLAMQRIKALRVLRDAVGTL